MNPTEAYNILVYYRNYNNNKRPNIPGGLDQVAFITDGKRLKTGKEFPHIKCFKCGKFGHYKSDCTESKEKESGGEVCQIIQVTTLMTRTNQLNIKESIDPLWILCDNESTVDIIKNRYMVTDIRVTNNPIEITGIGGQPIQVKHIGDLKGYGTVYHHPDVAANILSFCNLSRRFKSVTHDNNKKDAFIVERDEGSKMEFIPSKEGLYHYDFKLIIERCKEQKKPAERTMVIQTVEGIKRNFNKKEIDQANEARRLYVILGRPSHKVFEDIMKRGKLINNQVTVQDFKNAMQIYGIDLGVLKGKTTRSKANPIKVQFLKYRNQRI